MHVCLCMSVCLCVCACLCECAHTTHVCTCVFCVCMHACTCVWQGSGMQGAQKKRSLSTPHPSPAWVEQKQTPALGLPWPGPCLPLLSCSAPGISDSPAARARGRARILAGHIVPALSAACCVMNKHPVTHQLEDVPCANGPAEGGESRAWVQGRPATDQWALAAA